MNNSTNYIEALKHKFVIAYDISTYGHKKYIGFDTKNEAIEYMATSNKNNFYEVINSDAVMLYFDKDKMKMTEEEFLKDYEKLCELIPHFMANTQDPDDNKYKANIKDNKLTRGSFDIYTKRDKDGFIVSAHYVSNEFYTTQENNKILCEKLNEFGLSFDASIYSKNRLFCLNGNCKFGKTTVFEYDKINYNEYDGDKYVSWFEKDDYEEIEFYFKTCEPLLIIEDSKNKETVIFDKKDIKTYLLNMNDKLWGCSTLWKAVLNYIKTNNLMTKKEFCEMSIIQHKGSNRKKYNFVKNCHCWELSRGVTSDYYMVNILTKCNDTYQYILNKDCMITDDEWVFINESFNLTDDYKANINEQITEKIINKTNDPKSNDKYNYNYNNLYVNIKTGFITYNDKTTNLFLEYGNRSVFGTEKMEFDVICNTQDELIDAIYEDNEDNKCVLINGKWGAGKTKALDKIINDKKHGIVCLSENNALNGELKHRLSRNGVKFLSHLDFKDNNITKTNKDKNYIISLESIHLIDEVDYLILDEVVSIIQHFNSSKTMDKYSKDAITDTPLLDKYIKLINVINKAKKVFCMDADITKDIKNIISCMFNTETKIKSYNLLQHNYNDYTFNYYDNKPTMEKDIITNIRNGKNCVIVCNRSDYCGAYERLYKNVAKSILKITKDELTFIKDGDVIVKLNMEREIKEFVNIIDTKISELKPQLLIYSPKLSTGISINTVLYDKLYCLTDNNSVSPRTLIQMIFRVRTLLNKEINFYFECGIHRPKNTFNIKDVSNILSHNKRQIDIYNRQTLELLKVFDDVSETRERQLDPDYNNDNKKIDNNYINFRTFNLQEKLITQNLFIQQFFNIFCINHGFKLNYNLEKDDFKSGFKDAKEKGLYDKAIFYSTIRLITPSQYIEYKELMKTREWKDKTPYEKSKIETEIEKFNDLVKLNMNCNSYKTHGLYQYDELIKIYNAINNNIEWIHIFLKEKKEITQTQIRYFTDNAFKKMPDYTSEKIDLTLQFNKMNQLLKMFNITIGKASNIKIDMFNAIIEKNIKWFNDNLLIEYNKTHKEQMTEFNKNNTKQIFKLIVNELKHFFKVTKTDNQKGVFIAPYEYIKYGDSITDHKRKFKEEEFLRISQYMPSSYVFVNKEQSHENKRKASHEWFKNIVGLVKHNMKQDVKLGHNEQIIANEHNNKIKDPKSRKHAIYTNEFNNKKLIQQQDDILWIQQQDETYIIQQKDKTYKEYKPILNKKTIALRNRKNYIDVTKQLIKENENIKENEYYKLKYEFDRPTYKTEIKRQIIYRLYKIDILKEPQQMTVMVN